MLTGGAGSDTAVYLGVDGIGGTVSITVDLGQAGAQDTGEGVDILSGIENVTGGAGDDTLVGDGQSNELNGGGGNDVLTGGLEGDMLIGGDGVDTAVFGTASGTIIHVHVDLGSGGSQDTGEGVDTLVGIENLTGGLGNDTLIGDDQNNTLDGGAGNDVLTGGLADDMLAGGDGIDTAVFLDLAAVGVTVDLGETKPQTTGKARTR